MKELLTEIRSCTHCEKFLPLGARPILSANRKSKIVVVGQAPGIRVHKSGIPWNDKSGENLRGWMGVDEDTFYNPNNFAIIPIGFCYPGKAKTGDKPPRKECAPLWHEQLWELMESVELTLLIGKHAQDFYLPKEKKINLTTKVRNFHTYLPQYMVLPHPSPLNNIWRAKNRWFEKENVPFLSHKIDEILYPT